jgi:hypothetical protein
LSEINHVFWNEWQGRRNSYRQAQAILKRRPDSGHAHFTMAYVLRPWPPKGMGGAWRDDHPDNIQATHWWCNGEKDQPEWND